LYRVYSVSIDNIMTCRPIARERVGKHVPMEMDSWKPTRYGEHVTVDKGDEQAFPWIRICYVTGDPDQKRIQS
jgi:hypothetical protein